MTSPRAAERRPADHQAASHSLSTSTPSSVGPTADVRGNELPWRASCPWAASVIAAGRAAGVLPTYGSTEWLDLDPSDPRRLAALVVAAECWQHAGRAEVMAEQLRDDLALTDQLVVERVRRTSWDVAGARDWHAASRRPTHAELVERRRWSA